MTQLLKKSVNTDWNIPADFKVILAPSVPIYVPYRKHQGMKSSDLHRRN